MDYFDWLMRPIYREGFVRPPNQKRLNPDIRSQSRLNLTTQRIREHGPLDQALRAVGNPTPQEKGCEGLHVYIERYDVCFLCLYGGRIRPRCHRDRASCHEHPLGVPITCNLLRKAEPASVVRPSQRAWSPSSAAAASACCGLSRFLHLQSTNTCKRTLSDDN